MPIFKKFRGSGDLPSKAIVFDAVTPDRIPIATTATVILMQVTIPKGMVGVIERFGHDLETAAAFDLVKWTFRINKKQFAPASLEWKYDVAGTLTQGYQYRNFKVMLGPMYDPFWFPVPFILKARETFEVIAENTDVGDHCALARLAGYAYEELDP